MQYYCVGVGSMQYYCVGVGSMQYYCVGMGSMRYYVFRGLIQYYVWGGQCNIMCVYRGGVM